MNVVLSRPQTKIYLSQAKYVGCAAGLGSGKTFSISLKMYDTYFKYRGASLVYVAPTYRDIRDIMYPIMEEHLINARVPYSLNKSDAVLQVPGHGRIFFRSMTKPEDIIGFSVLDAYLDEIDVVSEDRAGVVLDKIIARIRQKVPAKKNQVYCISSPEGFKFMYNNFEKTPLKDSELIRMTTYSNQKNLPDDYIQNMLDKYPRSMIEAYLLGLFVNINKNEVWKDYDVKLNDSEEVPLPGERLHIGIDFNVAKGCQVIHVKRGEDFHAVGEIVETYDTPEAILETKNQYPNHPITMYPDASGKGRKSINATESDLKLLKEAGFLLKVKTKNPNVKDRITATNAVFCNGLGVRRYFINSKRCPVYSNALQHQVYDDYGQPKKDGKLDNVTDAGTYPVAYLFPVKGSRVFEELDMGVI